MHKLPIQEIAKKSWAKLQKSDLSPIPVNYEVLYAYYEGMRPDLNHAVDMAIEKLGDLNDEICQDIYQRLIDDKVSNSAILRAGDQVYEMVRDITNKVQQAKEAAHNYNGQIQDISTKIVTEKDVKKLEQMLQKVVSETQGLLQRNAELEEHLDRSTEVMSMLQKDLDHVRREAVTDSLTGLANRKAFDMAYGTIVRESQNTKQTFALLMIDIDHFKNFNDSYGHQVGDQVLRLVAKTLKDGVRGKDIVTRYGGEEFALLLPNTPLSAGVAVANNLRKAVATKDVVNRSSGEVLGQITMSVGVAEYIDGEEIETLMERADKALYAAKKNGRNQVASADDNQKIKHGT